jgi:hypothetical protein
MKSTQTIVRGCTSTATVLLLLLLLLLAGSPNAASAYVRSPSFQHRAAMTTVQNPSRKQLQPLPRPSIVALGNSKNENDESIDDEIFIPTQNDRSNKAKEENEDENENENKSYNYLDDLTPPPVNFARNSILFSEQPSTKLRNNPPLTVWKFSRTYLPAVITGAWSWRDTDVLDERPLAALYNALLVRLPVIVVGTSYLYQKIAEGHDLIIDLGFDANGPQAVPPVLVIAVLVLILL